MSAAVKNHLKFAASVALVFGLIYAFQKNVKVVPGVGQYLPGGQ